MLRKPEISKLRMKRRKEKMKKKYQNPKKRKRLSLTRTKDLLQLQNSQEVVRRLFVKL